MADHDHDDATGGAERLPAVRPPSAPAPVDRTGELVRAAGSPLTAGPMMAAPMMVAAAMQATATAMTEALAAMVRPWLIGVPVTPPEREWAGPGVHVSYTHLEVRWPAR
jgi:hypothetical protein